MIISEISCYLTSMDLSALVVTTTSPRNFTLLLNGCWVVSLDTTSEKTKYCVLYLIKYTFLINSLLYSTLMEERKKVLDDLVSKVIQMSDDEIA